MNQLREEQIQAKKERRRMQIMNRRAEREALAQEIMTWEDTVLFSGKKDLMKAMWEVMLDITVSFLNYPEVHCITFATFYILKGIV